MRVMRTYFSSRQILLLTVFSQVCAWEGAFLHSLDFYWDPEDTGKKASEKRSWASWEEMFWAHKSFSSPLCNKGLQRVVKGGRAADSSGSTVWGCWAVLVAPTSWYWTEMFHGRKDEAGCGKWEPPSWPCPQRDETAWQGETEAGKSQRYIPQLFIWYETKATSPNHCVD